MKRLVILGSTGSIGRRALDVVRDFSHKLKVVGLATQRNIELLEKQIAEFGPQWVAVTEPYFAFQCPYLQQKYHLKVYVGENALQQIISECEADMVLIATTGAVGLIPTLMSIERGMDIALANKEVMVVGGELVMQEAQKHRVNILPVDSEHSAILQCLAGQTRSAVNRIILTASGGPFLGMTEEELARIKVEDALNHPTWSMGKKITVDSATLMNKGFEVIEVKHFFGISVEQIQVVIHRQSIIHSMVEFVDGSVLAQLSFTDMYLPIQLALSWPERWENKFPRLDFYNQSALTFEPPAPDRFPCLQYAYESARIGGTMPVVLNAANEIAVQRFLEGEISFLDIPQIIKSVLVKHKTILHPSLEDILATDRWARAEAKEYVP